MANQFSWSYPSLDVMYAADGYSNVVQAVHWIYSCTDGMHYEQMVGCTPLPPPAGTFVKYDDLTPAVVTSWMLACLGKETIAEMTDELNKRIAAQVKPKGASEPPPWDQG